LRRGRPDDVGLSRLITDAGLRDVVERRAPDPGLDPQRWRVVTVPRGAFPKHFGTFAGSSRSSDPTNRSIRFPVRAFRGHLERTDREGVLRSFGPFRPVSSALLEDHLGTLVRPEDLTAATRGMANQLAGESSELWCWDPARRAAQVDGSGDGSELMLQGRPGN